MHLNFSRGLAIALVAGSAWCAGPVFAQLQQGTTGQNQTGLTQTGESSNFVIQRDASQSVAATSTNFLSNSSAPGTSGTSFGTVQGFGSLSGTSGGGGLGGLTTLGGGRGGIGGIGGLGGFGGIGGIGGIGGFGNQFGGLQTGQAGVAAGQLPLRHRIRVDIVTSPRSITRISEAFAQRLTRLPGLKGIQSVDVTMEGQTAVLTGSVDSDRSRELVARLAMLEPGIAAVRNELLVTPTEAPADSLPPMR